VNPKLLQRQVALAGVALVAPLGSLALGRAEAGDGGAPADGVPPARGTWYDAVVGTFGPGLYGRTTACGVRLVRDTSGIAHPELPCGVKVVLANEGREVETAVVDKGLVGARHDFDVTQALAEELGISGVRLVRWRFAEKS
jgi:rare lipoprotein A